MAGAIALLASGALTEAGLFTVAAEGAASLGLGATASNLAGGAVVGKAGQIIEKKVLEGAQAVGESVFGTEEFSAIEKSVYETILDAKAAYGGDVDYFIKKSGPKTFNEDEIYNIPSANVVPDLGNLLSDVGAADLSKFAVDYSNSLSKQAFSGTVLDPTLALHETLMHTNNDKIAQVVVPYLLEKGFDKEAYQKISSVYNGLDMTIDKNMQQYYDDEQGLIYFVLTDETGKSVRLDQTTGLIIPALFDTFLGALSQNNTMPTTLTGLFCAFHDYSYTGGISRQGDMQLLSRLSQNYFRMTEQERPFARLAMVYFSTLGSIASSFFGKTDSDEGIYEAIMPLGDGDVSGPDGKAIFYQELEENLEEMNVTQGIVSSASSMGYTTSLYSDFSKIMIQLS